MSIFSKMGPGNLLKVSEQLKPSVLPTWNEWRRLEKFPQNRVLRSAFMTQLILALCNQSWLHNLL